ncbi:MAG: hypothetical protein HDS11_04760 [Bacteroides sp.]|nr:hypothetical protein [Bacteroides sp.]
MIRVTNEFHYVKADSKLRHRWAILTFKAAAAYAMGDTESYNRLYQTVRTEYSDWKANAEKECNRKSYKNWLGGGESYIVSESDPTESINRFYAIFQGRSHQQIINTLMEMERDNWLQLYSPV